MILLIVLYIKRLDLTRFIGSPYRRPCSSSLTARSAAAKSCSSAVKFCCCTVDEDEGAANEDESVGGKEASDEAEAGVFWRMFS